MKHVENVDVAKIVEAMGVVSNMIDEGNDAAFNIPCNEIATRSILVRSGSENKVTALGEDDVEKKSLIIKSYLKVFRHDKAMMKKLCSEEFEGGYKMNELVKEVAKTLMKDKGLNDKVEEKETDINGHNISVTKVENDDLAMDDNNDLVRCRIKDNNDGDEAPDGRARNHEFNFHDEKSWSNEHLDCNKELVIKSEREEKGRLDVRNKANRLGDNGVKGKGMEAKIYDNFDEAEKAYKKTQE
ncbi:18595_t:CDS:2 [Gigaspora margarita]|uniref:18595_t:CDS:1 n=1 Tax=Gigaspora margarita TaxID=4874 RepID=A0ABN7VG76_GIGMA|nr:18595_t:CDS:2 [Gigaspora margarita]